MTDRRKRNDFFALCFGGGPASSRCDGREGLALEQLLHAQVALGPPVRAGQVPQTCCRQHQGCVTVRERTDHAGPPPDLAHQPLQRVVGPDPPPVRLGERVVGEGLGDAGLDLVGGGRQLHLPQLDYHLVGLSLRRLDVLGGMDRLEHRRHLAHLAAGHHAEHVAVEVHHAALPAGLGVVLAQSPGHQ